MTAAATTAAVGIALHRLLPVIARIAGVYGPLAPEVQREGQIVIGSTTRIR
ncbi:MAG TPA: hypothetical protein VFG58_05500 [Solirubrobacterales bacterium]|nr:hypothetical protein [Solirubrobacterales bacterium]